MDPFFYDDTDRRYHQDSEFRHAVQMMMALADRHGFTPGELKQMAFKAAFELEMMSVRRQAIGPHTVAVEQLAATTRVKADTVEALAALMRDPGNEGERQAFLSSAGRDIGPAAKALNGAIESTRASQEGSDHE